MKSVNGDQAQGAFFVLSSFNGIYFFKKNLYNQLAFGLWID
jgi:hypothetical protein